VGHRAKVKDQASTPPKCTEYLDGWCTGRYAAWLCNISPGTWRGYVARGHAPAPEVQLGPVCLWREDAVIEWRDSRPGPGWRGPHKGKLELERRAAPALPAGRARRTGRQ